MSQTRAKHAREFLLTEYQGVLSTHSKKVPGYPFGSVVPYCLDAAGWPLLLISRIAQHTHNLAMDPRCSLLVPERCADDFQASGRLTMLGQAKQLVDEDAIELAAGRYYRYFPQTLDYHVIHDFDFWVLHPVQWRFIGGFGDVHWLDAKSVPQANPFVGDMEGSMLEHMNVDHAPSVRHFAELAGLDDNSDEPVELVGIDTEGFHLRQGVTLHWLKFPATCDSMDQIRQMFIRLAEARSWPPDDGDVPQDTDSA